jgi:hypothetical protein
MVDSQLDATAARVFHFGCDWIGECHAGCVQMPMALHIAPLGLQSAQSSPTFLPRATRCPVSVHYHVVLVEERLCTDMGRDTLLLSFPFPSDSHGPERVDHPDDRSIFPS